MQLDTQPCHLELSNPVFWKSEDWKEELGLWGFCGHYEGHGGGL
jgi:hypothetical protein